MRGQGSRFPFYICVWGNGGEHAVSCRFDQQEQQHARIIPPTHPKTNGKNGQKRQVATFIVQKILLDEMGLNYICATAERFFAVRCFGYGGVMCSRG